MSDYVQKFIDFLSSKGALPSSASEIIGDDTKRRFHISGDKKGSKNGAYQLKPECGWFINFKEGVTHTWVNSGDLLPKKDRQEWLKKVAEEKKIKEKQIKVEREKAAITAQSIWDNADNADKSHPYLVKKLINDPQGIRQNGDDLIIPAFKDNKITSLQFIKPDGAKLFLPHGDISGAAGLIGFIEGALEVYIAEGFATAHSVSVATGKPCLYAFNAGNLLSVAKALREDMPDIKIILAADNDQWTQVNKKPHNTGLICARAAALEIKGYISYPDFEHTDPQKPTDWNDYFLRYGAGKTCVAVESNAQAVDRALPESSLDLIPSDGKKEAPASLEWTAGLETNKKGEINPRSTANLLLICENEPELDGVFIYDAFAKRITVRHCPPWENEESFKVRQLQDFDYTRLEAWLEKKWGVSSGKNKISDAINSTATLPKNTINPATDYFNSLEWDGEERIDTWLYNYASDQKQPKEYLALVGRKFLCGLAARAMKPGIKFDTMIVLEGKQYAGKSFLSRVIATINGEEYFLDDFKDIENKDALMKMQGKLVIEFPEITTMRKAEVDDLKAFLSRTHDVFRPPYGYNTIESPRQCVFIGTVNPEGPYLRDVTGNRRYWPVSCRDKIEMDKLREIMPQLHAEAAHFVKKGEQLWLTDEEYELCVREQDQRVMTDIWINKIEEIVKNRDEITTDDLLLELSIPMDKRTRLIYSRLMQVMVSLGFEYGRIGKGASRKRGYTRKGLNGTFEIQDVVSW